jgi:hypothetical protein
MRKNPPWQDGSDPIGFCIRFAYSQLPFPWQILPSSFGLSEWPVPTKINLLKCIFIYFYCFCHFALYETINNSTNLIGQVWTFLHLGLNLWHPAFGAKLIHFGNTFNYLLYLFVGHIQRLPRFLVLPKVFQLKFAIKFNYVNFLL